LLVDCRDRDVADLGQVFPTGIVSLSTFSMQHGKTGATSDVKLQSANNASMFTCQDCKKSTSHVSRLDSACPKFRKKADKEIVDGDDEEDDGKEVSDDSESDRSPRKRGEKALKIKANNGSKEKKKIDKVLYSSS